MSDFDVVDDALTKPWRWLREGRNAALGSWLAAARQELLATGRLVLDNAPITWVPYDAPLDAPSVLAATCWRVRPAANETVVALLKWPRESPGFAQRMGGRWPIVERFDDPDLLRLGEELLDADGPTSVELVVDFVSARMTAMGAALKTAVSAIKAGRDVSRITKNREHADRLCALADAPTPTHALAWLDGVLAKRNEWFLYRRECVFQLREALRHCNGETFADLPAEIAAVRSRARHRGRPTHRSTIGTPLLVKGLEFDHAVLLWKSEISVQELYVALTRAAKSLTIVSNSPTLLPVSGGAKAAVPG